MSNSRKLRRAAALAAQDQSGAYGKPLDARGLAERLKPYGVRSRQVRIGEASLKGYRRDDLWDVWSRYLPPVFRNMGNMGNAAASDVSDVSHVSDDPQTCAGCGQSMAVIEAGQRYHPLCEPSSDLQETLT
jgi:hypothetical protein